MPLHTRLLAIFLGFKSFSTIDAFVNIVTTTPEGLGFLGVLIVARPGIAPLEAGHGAATAR